MREVLAKDPHTNAYLTAERTKLRSCLRVARRKITGLNHVIRFLLDTVGKNLTPRETTQPFGRLRGNK